MILPGYTASSASFQANAIESTASFIGIIVAISGNVVISLALNCQKLAHQRIKQEQRLAHRPLKIVQTSSTQRYAKAASLKSTSELVGAVDPQEGRSGDDLYNDRTRVAGTFQNYSTNSDEDINYGENTRYSPLHLLQSARENDNDPGFETSPLLSILSRKQASAESLRSSYGTQEILPETEVYLPRSSTLRRHPPPLPLRAPTVASKVKAKGTTSFHDADLEAATSTDQAYSGVRYTEVDSTEALEEMYESSYLKSKLWWIGFVLMSVGEMGNFISYAFAPASVVAPLGTFALIANCFFAPLMLNERFKKRDLFGVGFAILGAVTVVLSASPSDRRLDPDSLKCAYTRRPFVLLGVSYAVGIICLASLSSQKVGQQNIFVDVGACALFGGFTVLATKAISSLLTLEWTAIFGRWITYPVLVVLVGTAIGQIRYLNRALKKFDSKAVIPTQFVLFNLSAIIGSAVLYGDFRDASFHQMLTFLYGCISTFIGVYMLAWRSHVQNEEEEPGGAGRDGVQTEQASQSPTPVGSRRVRPSSVARHKTSKGLLSLVAILSAQLALLRAPEERHADGVEDD